MREENKSISLARCVRLGGKESLHELGRVGNEVLKFAIDRVNRENGIFADIGVTVFETSAASRDKRF